MALSNDPCQEDGNQEPQKRNDQLLIDIAERKLEELSEHKRSIGEFESSHELLLKRYQIQSSLFEKMTDTFSSTPFYFKVCVGLLTVSLSALVGAVVNLSLLFAATTAALVGVCSMLLNNHSSCQTQKNKQLKKDLEKMEQDIATEVETLKAIEGELRATLSNIAKENIRLAKNNGELEAMVGKLDEKIGTMGTAIENLTQTKDKVSEANRQLIEEVLALSEKIKSTHKELSIKSAAIPRLAKKLSNRTQELNKTNNALDEMETQYEELLVQLKELEKNSRDQLEKISELTKQLKSKDLAYRNLEAHNDALLQSIDRQMEEDTETVNQALTKSDDVIARAMAFLDQTNSPRC